MLQAKQSLGLLNFVLALQIPTKGTQQLDLKTILNVETINNEQR